MVGLVAAVLLADAVLWQRCGLQGCPDVLRLRAYQPGGAPVLYDRRGRPWGELRPVDRVIVSLDSLPWYVPAAFVAVEDKRFYKHHGVDWPRVLGAALRDIRSGGYAQGFSTIPMQLARNVWSDRIPAQQKTLRRKMLEIRVALEIERKFSKKEILELYLNNIYFGDGAYGIEAAARDYYHRPAKALSLQQAAMLAALPRAPALYDPRDHPDRARQRRNLVLSLMSSGGFASAQLTAEAASRPLGVADQPARVPGQGIGRYFAELVRRQMEAQYGEDLYRSKMKIVTTLDVDAQRAAEEELEKQLRAIEGGELGPYRGPRYRPHRIPGEAGTDYLQGAVVVMDAHSGDVLALVGGRDYEDSRYDRALQARRQTGSSFKPFVYGRALQAGIPISQHLLDEPMTLMIGRTPWTPRDYGDRYRGDVTMREAITNSLNVPTVRLARVLGVGSVINFAHRIGLTAPIYNGPSAALGTAEVTPLELTRAYTAFATLGTRAEPRIVRRVVSADNQILWEAAPPRQTPVVDAGVAYILTDMLRDVVEKGTGTPVRDAGFQGPVAGKTGTTSDA
ncbi:MAG TPA: PBP1A family penicillin-binding protein, partial [Longimicrobiales bacterium]